MIEAEMNLNMEQLRNLLMRQQHSSERHRENVARAIHDELGQIMAAVRMNVAWIKRECPDRPRIVEKSSETLELIDGSIKSIRKICSELRPDVLDHLGLGAAIEWETEEFVKKSGILCEVTVEGCFQMDSDRSIALFRIFQEALTNILHHANSTKVTARLKGEDDKIVLEISDNGKGITEEDISNPDSFGLLGMRERVYPWRGSVNISSSPDKGTRIEVILPQE